MSYGFLHVGRVLRVDDPSGGYYLESVGLARTSTWGPVPSCIPGLIAGDRVILGAKGTSRDDLVILAKIDNTFPDILDIPGLVAALAAKASTAALTAAVATLNATDAALATADTVLTGRVGTAEATLITHADAIGTNAGAISAVASNLTTHAGILGLHGGLLPVATHTARNALTGNYDGRPIYRQDRDWIEVYDGTAWRVQGTVQCASAADRDSVSGITNPVTGQLCRHTDDGLTYRYTGSAWLVHQFYRTETLLAAPAATITFASIPTNLSRLTVEWSARGTASALTSTLRMRINGNTAAVYESNITTQNATALAGTTELAATQATVGTVTAATAQPGSLAAGEIVLPAWKSSGVALGALWRSHMLEGSGSGNSFLVSGGMRFYNGDPRTSLSFFLSAGNLDTGSRITVHGWE